VILFLSGALFGAYAMWMYVTFWVLKGWRLKPEQKQPNAP